VVGDVGGGSGADQSRDVGGGVDGADQLLQLRAKYRKRKTSSFGELYRRYGNRRSHCALPMQVERYFSNTAANKFDMEVRSWRRTVFIGPPFTLIRVKLFILKHVSALACDSTILHESLDGIGHVVDLLCNEQGHREFIVGWGGHCVEQGIDETGKNFPSNPTPPINDQCIKSRRWCHMLLWVTYATCSFVEIGHFFRIKYEIDVLVHCYPAVFAQQVTAMFPARDGGGIASLNFWKGCNGGGSAFS